MNREALKKLLLAAAKGQGHADFSADVIDETVRKALADHYGVSDRSFRRLSAADFELIEEVIEELTPKSVEDVIGQFAEVRTFARDEQVVFTVRNSGKQRVMRAIVPGARAGIYEARRLDNKHLHMLTNVETVGYALSLEDLITGRVTIQDYVEIVTQGFVEVVYQRMIAALRQGALEAPAANRVEVDGSEEALVKGLDGVIRIVSAYGTPTIFAFQSAATMINNYLSFSGFPANAYSGLDAADIREYGYVTKYKGVSVVVLPNFLTDNSNTSWLFKEDEMFIMPANEKPIKVAFAGDLWVQEVPIPSGGVEFHAHREMGVAVIANNAIGSVRVTDEEIGGIGSW